VDNSFSWLPKYYIIHNSPPVPYITVVPSSPSDPTKYRAYRPHPMNHLNDVFDNEVDFRDIDWIHDELGKKNNMEEILEIEDLTKKHRKRWKTTGRGTLPSQVILRFCIYDKINVSIKLCT